MLTFYAHALRSRISSFIVLTLHVHNKARTSHTLTTHAHYTRVSKAPHTTNIFAHMPWNHADASRSRIAFPHHVHASLTLHYHNKDRASHQTHAHYTRVSKAIRIFAHTPTNRLTHHAHVSHSRITFKNRFHASISSIALTLHVHDKPARLTLTTHAHYKRIPKAPHITRIFANTLRRITFTHRVHASRSRISFKHCA
jgi:hypothetical protein